MGLLAKLRRVREERADRKVRETLRIAGPVLSEDQRQRWATMNEKLGPTLAQFVALKWRLDVNEWKPGDIIRRPRSAEELAAALREEANVDVELILSIDQKLVERFQSSWRGKYAGASPAPGSEAWRWDLQWDFMQVPIAEAQEWWDGKYGDSFNVDGSTKQPRA